MAQALDLEEQEQLAEVKAFWRQWGNLITGVLTALMLTYAGWNFYQYWQRQQAVEAAALQDEVEVALAGSDPARIDRVWADMQARYARTLVAQQAALAVARRNAELGRRDAATGVLNWVIASGADSGYQALARLRLAGLQLDAGQPDAAIQTLDASVAAAYLALYADRRGDALAAKGDSAGARAQYQAAYLALNSGDALRAVVEVKLNALGVDAKTLGAAAAPRT